MIHGFSLVFLVTVSLSALSALAAPKPEITLDAQAEFISVVAQLRYLEDAQGDLTIAQIKPLPDTNWTSTSAQNLPSFGHTPSIFWLNMQLDPKMLESDMDDYLLELNNPTFDLLHIYYYQNDQLIYENTVGRSISFSQRPIDHRHFLFPIDFSDLKPIDVYIAVKSVNTLKVPINIWKRAAFERFDKAVTLVYGMTYGLLLVMVFFNIFIFFTTRDRGFLLISVLTFIFSVNQATLHGFTIQYIWPDATYWNQYTVHILRPLTFFISIVFAIEFLNLSKSRHFYRVFAIFGFIGLAITLFNTGTVATKIAPSMPHFFVNFNWMQSILTTILSFYCIYTGLYLWLKESQKSARFFFMAWVLPLIFFPLFTLSKLPEAAGFFRGETWLATLAASSSILLLSFAVSDRINEMKNQLATANHYLTISRNNINNLIDRAPIMLLITDLKSTIKDVNSLLLDRLKFDKDEILEQPLALVTPKLPSSVINKHLGNASNAQFESSFLTKNQEAIPVLVSVSQLFDINSQETRNVLAAQDLSELKKMQQESYELHRRLNQTQRLKTIGTFTSGIAHDMNNILTPIIGYGEMMLADFDKGSKYHEFLSEQMKASERGSDLVQQLLNFSRINDEEEISGVLIEQNIQDSMEDSINFIRVLLPNNIKITYDIKKDCPSVKLIRNSFHQILVNLCTNAAHAMDKENSQIHITLFPVKNSADYPIITKPGKFLACSVSDNGTGIASDQLDRIFEPFYSTKSRTQGTGLGLSIVYSLVTKNQGFIDVESTLNKGTTFNLYFPTHLASSENQEDSDSTETTLQTGHERILYVDDEPSITNLLQERLRDLGYDVMVFNDSQEALGEIQKNPDSFDLVISDYSMPELDGISLAKRIRMINSQLPIILVTGQSEILKAERLKESGINTHLPKPIDMLALNRAMRDLLST